MFNMIDGGFDCVLCVNLCVFYGKGVCFLICVGYCCCGSEYGFVGWLGLIVWRGVLVGGEWVWVVWCGCVLEN